MTLATSQDSCRGIAQSIIACLGNLGAEKFLEAKSRFHDFQQDPVGFGEQVLGEHYTDDVKAMMESVRDNEVTVALSSNGVGKSQPVDTPVLTPEGFRPIGSLTVGDIVFGRDGKPTTIIGVYPQGLQPTLKITFNDGSFTFCSEDHLWDARSASMKYCNGKYNTYSAKKLSTMLHRVMHIPMCEPVEFASKDLLLDPYVMGVLLGDGTLGQSARFDSADQQIVYEMVRRIPDASVKLYRKTHYGIITPPGKANPVLMALSAYGLRGLSAKDKHIPSPYLFGSVEQRKDLLAGLMDTDGYIDHKSCFDFSTISPRLANELQWLVWSLGGTAKIKNRVTSFTHKGIKKNGSPSFRVQIKIPFCPFYLKRKCARWRDPKEMTRQAHRVIESIKPVGIMESVCIKVDNKDSLYITENFIVTHNTHSAGRLGVWFLKCFEESQVYTAAAPPESNLRKLLWGEIGSITDKHSSLFENYQVNTLNIQGSSRHFITGVTIPTAGDEKTREARFCADVDDLFEMHDGSVVRYGDLIGRNGILVVSVNPQFKRRWSQAEFFDNGTKLVWEIKFDDGEVIHRTGNHPLFAGWDIHRDYGTYNGKHTKGQVRVGSEGWLPVSELTEDHAVLCPDDTGFNFGVEKADENRIKFLAYMIGDGCFKGHNEHYIRLQFTQEDNAQRAEFLRILDEMGSLYSISDKEKYNWAGITINDQRLRDFIKECGLASHGSENKFIPAFVNHLDREYVALFLNRLFATDGWASLTNKAEIGYCSKSERLVRDVQRLLRRFGIKSKIIPKVVNWTHDGESRSGIYWSLYLCHAIDVLRFADQIGIFGKEAAVETCREYSENRQHLYAGWVFEKPGYRWKKISAIRVVGERPTVGVHVPGDNTYLTSLVEHNSGKHGKNLMFIVDEGDAVPDEVYKGIEACASGGHYRVLIMLNPRQPKGAVYRMIRDGKANVVHLSAFRHPNVVTGETVIPGAVDRNTTARRISQMCRYMTEEEVVEMVDSAGDKPADVFELPSYLENYRATDQKGVLLPPLSLGYYKVMDQAFCHMVLGRYPAQAADQLISMEWIQKARMRWDLWVKRYGEVPPDRAQGIAGVDVGELGNDPSVWFARYGGWLTQAKQWSGVDTNHTSDRAIEFGKQGSVICTNFDGNGVGAGCAPNVMRKGYPARGVKTQEKPDDREKQLEWGEFKILRDQLGWEVREWLRADPTSMLPPDEELIEELAVFTYEVKGRWIQLMKKDVVYDLLKRSPNKFSALCLTFAKPLDVSGATSGMSAQRAAELRAKHSRYGYTRGR